MNNTYKCPVCNGEPAPNKVVNGITFTNCICEFCWGKKNVTWIEAVFGVDQSYFIERFKKDALDTDYE